MRKVMLGAVIVLMVLTVLAAAYQGLFFFAQRSLIYAARRAGPAFPPRDTRILKLAGHGGPVEAWYLPPLTRGSARAPLLLFTHGNAELIDDGADRFDAPRAAGYAVLLLEYPGYGRSAGEPTQESIAAAALAAYDWAANAPDVDPARIIPYGRSLGGGAACIIAAHRPIAALILESCFTSIRPLGRQYFVPGFLVRDPFDNEAALRGYRGPLLVLHGLDDGIIPVAHGRALAASVPGADLALMACGHNDCPPAWDRILDFLDKAAGGARVSEPRRPSP